MKRIRSERSSAVLVVLTFTVVISALLAANAVMLHQLRQELRRVEIQQQNKFQKPAPTLAPAVEIR